MATDWTNVAGVGLTFEVPRDAAGNKDYLGAGRVIGALAGAMPEGYLAQPVDPEEPTEVFVGLAVVTDHEGGPHARWTTLPDLAEIERVVTDLLRPHGVKASRPFGLHSYQVPSWSPS